MVREERIKLLRQYLEEDPGDQFTRYALALEHIASGNNQEGILLLERVAAEQDGFLAVYYQLGKAYESQAETVKAIACYKKGIEIAALQRNQKTLTELKTALFSLDVS